jgi:hypothetical protein
MLQPPLVSFAKDKQDTLHYTKKVMVSSVMFIPQEEEGKYNNNAFQNYTV